MLRFLSSGLYVQAYCIERLSLTFIFASLARLEQSFVCAYCVCASGAAASHLYRQVTHHCIAGWWGCGGGGWHVRGGEAARVAHLH